MLHRAITLVVMMLVAVGLIVLLTAGAISSLDSHSLIALGVVVVAAAISGIAFSWNRYFKNPREVRGFASTSRGPLNKRRG